MTEPANESDRGTGKTFRKILEALYYFSEGRQVIFVCTTHSAVQYSYMKALGIADVFGLPTTKHIIRCELTLGKSSLRFISKGDAKTGIPSFFLVIKDL